MIAGLVSACRAAGIRVSTAETLDAMRAAADIGLEDRTSLKIALGQALAKTMGDKKLFSDCFDRYVQLSGASAQAGGVSLEERTQMTAEMMQAASQIGLDRIQLFTQRGLYVRRLLEAVGAPDIGAPDIAPRGEGQGEGAGEAQEAAQEKAQRRRLAALTEQARYLVDRQLEISQGENMLRVRSEMLMDTALGETDQRDMEIMSYQVRRLAKRLAAQTSRRRKCYQRGHPDIARSLRANLKNDGVMLNLIWKRKKINRPRIFALCDVSGSVSSAVLFLLMFLYNLTDVVRDVRAFAFSNRLGDVSELFGESEFSEAYRLALRLYGGGSTDYGQSLRDFAEQAGSVIDRKTVIIILGDGRSNYGDCGADVLARLSSYAGRVIWLNPENESLWGSGDSEMPKLSAAVDVVYPCQTLRQLTRIIDDTIKMRV